MVQLAEYAHAEKAILVVLGLGVIVYWPHRKAPSLHLADTASKQFHCLDCHPATAWNVVAYREHLQSHTRRKKTYPVFAVTSDGIWAWPQKTDRMV